MRPPEPCQRCGDPVEWSGHPVLDNKLVLTDSLPTCEACARGPKIPVKCWRCKTVLYEHDPRRYPLSGPSVCEACSSYGFPEEAFRRPE